MMMGQNEITAVVSRNDTYGDERENKAKNPEREKKKRNKHKKDKKPNFGIKLRNSKFSKVFWGWATQLNFFYKERTVGVNHLSILHLST